MTLFPDLWEPTATRLEHSLCQPLTQMALLCFRMAQKCHSPPCSTPGKVVRTGPRKATVRIPLRINRVLFSVSLILEQVFVVSRDTQSEKAISVLVADENRMACQLLAGSLERKSNFRVVGAAVNLSEAGESLKRAQPQVAIVSTNLKDGPLSGFEFLRDCRQSQTSTRVILLLDSSERNMVVDAFRAGARGVFCRSQSFKMLCKCIKCVHDGQIWADTNQMQFVVESLAPQTPADVVNAKGESLLTKREKEVVACVADGLSNREIAKQLSLSEHTVKNYLFRICDKVGTSGRVELVLYALAHSELSGRPSDNPAVSSVNPQALEILPAPERKPARPVTRAASASGTLSKKDPFGNLLTELFQ